MIYRHYRTEEKGAITVALKSGGGLTEVGVAWCSPLDQFSRAKGRLIASRRLEVKRGNGNYHAMPHHSEDIKPRQVIFAMLDSMRLPRWFEEFQEELKKQWDKRGEAQK